jgi:hypothetical protein
MCSGSRDYFLGAAIIHKDALSKLLLDSRPYRGKYRKDLQKSTFKVADVPECCDALRFGVTYRCKCRLTRSREEIMLRVF